MNKLVISKRALFEIEDSFLWYQKGSELVARKFRTQLENKFSELLLYPNRYAEKKSPFREVVLNKFPFSIVYEYLPKKNIVLIKSVFHFKRNPQMKHR